jgi:hypothetical protein
MEDWLTYRLSDLLLFSPRTYYRLFELYNHALWPAHVVAFGAGVTVLGLLRRNAAAHVAAITTLLSICWLWVAWAFHLERYATINWAARYFAAAFVAQAALVLWYGIRRRRRPLPSGHFGPDGVAYRVAVGIVFFALFVEPLIGPLVGREWTQLETFGAAPDPTAVATLGALTTPNLRAPRYLLVVPVLWCAISGATLWAMGTADALVVPIVGTLATTVAVGGRRA